MFYWILFIIDKSKSSLPSVSDNKDRILHTQTTTDEPIVNAKGDYGQGTPADQHLYTTRGNTNSTSSLDTQKKL